MIKSTLLATVFRYFVIGLVLASAAAVGIYAFKNQILKSENQVLALERNQAQTQVISQKASIDQLEKSASDNADAQRILLSHIADTKNFLNKHEQKIRNLERENEQIKSWINTPLPDAISQLREHPAFTGSEDYLRWLSIRDAMQITSDQPKNQR